MQSSTRRITTAVAASAVLAAALTGAATAASADRSTAAHQPRTLHLTADFKDGFNLDLGATGPSAGDQFGGNSTWSSGGKHVADVGATCTATSLQPAQYQCILSARFAHGVLTAQTLWDVQSTAPTDYAITGGSMAYRDATGDLTISNGAADVTIHLDNTH